eukprot:scaffold795_cov115-Isochrysis_galbana.AAC.6
MLHEVAGEVSDAALPLQSACFFLAPVGFLGSPWPHPCSHPWSHPWWHPHLLPWPRPGIHPSTRPPTCPSTRPLTHPLTFSSTRPWSRLLICPPTRPLTHLCTSLLAHRLTRPWTRPPARRQTRPWTRPPARRQTPPPQSLRPVAWAPCLGPDVRAGVMSSEREAMRRVDTGRWVVRRRKATTREAAPRATRLGVAWHCLRHDPSRVPGSAVACDVAMARPRSRPPPATPHGRTAVQTGRTAHRREWLAAEAWRRVRPPWWRSASWSDGWLACRLVCRLVCQLARPQL